MAALTKKTIASDSFMVPGNEVSTPAGLRRLAAGLAHLSGALPPDTDDLDLSTLKVSVEDGELVLVSISTRGREIQ